MIVASSDDYVPDTLLSAPPILTYINSSHFIDEKTEKQKG